MSDVIWERAEYPPEPAGPVWDEDGGKWERCGHSCGKWRSAWASCWSWNSVCAYTRKLTSTPPWEPEVGGTVETAEQYAAMPEGSVVEDSSGNVYRLAHEGPWLKTGSSNMYGYAELAGAPRTILRVGWGS